MDSVDEYSGSAYEISSDGDHISSEEEKIRTSSRANSKHDRGRSTSTNAITLVNRRLSSDDMSEHVSTTSSPGNRRLREDAIQWASTFQGPQSPQDINSPTRRPSGSRAKRKVDESASQLRAKRLKAFHNKEYRDLLNTEIHDAGAGSIYEDDNIPLEESQIGSSLWTSKEKHDFFFAISRLGRDNIREIALSIRSKSELEVQEYVLALQQATAERILEDRRKQQVIAFTDHPASFEISDECCSVLERAGDALAARQDLYEEQQEEGKWGDVWLLTMDISKWIEKHKKTEFGETEIERTLPAANLFNLKNWLDLSRWIFMNPAAPREEDNWQALAEPDQTPAIRATAFEDFHSVAVSITKRLISTTLFCTMSRLRARNAKKSKHADVSQDDVEAALKILGLKNNSREFWRGCPRRCNLDVFDDSINSGLGDRVDTLTYDEVESALGGEFNPRSRSRSRSMSQHEYSGRSGSNAGDRIGPGDLTDSLSVSDDLYSNDGSLYSQGPESGPEGDESLELTGGEFISSKTRREEARRKRAEEKKANTRAQEEYTEAFDQETNSIEERRLWTLLHQAVPFEIKPEPFEISDRPRTTKNGFEEQDWRENLEYWSQWETLPTPVLAESFMRNRERRSGRGRKRTYWATPASNLLRSSVSSDNAVPHDESEGEDDIRQFKDQEDPGASEGTSEEAVDDDDAVDTGHLLKTRRSPTSEVEDFTGSNDEVAIKGEYED